MYYIKTQIKYVRCLSNIYFIAYLNKSLEMLDNSSGTVLYADYLKRTEEQIEADDDHGISEYRKIELTLN